MSGYELSPLGTRAFASHKMLLVIRSLERDGQPPQRQQAVEFLAKQHGMSLSTTKSLRYDPTLIKREGINKKGHVRIGPKAFKQDSSWLANVIFHEVIHSDQFDFYARHGVTFGHHEAKSEPERVMVALDELEGFYWPWRNGRALGLDETQKKSLEREIRLWLVEVDDPKTVAFARKQQFNAARLALIERLRAGD